MEETHKPKANELMETEDQLHEEMREEFRERLKSRLQVRVAAKERDLPEVRRLKKKRPVDLHLKSTFGEITVRAQEGYSPERKTWVIPIREAWGLAPNQRLTPTLQRRLCSTAVETGSFEKASALAAEWGCFVSDDAIRSCAVALGRQARDAPLSTACADQAGPDDTLVIMMDGWMARHRGKDWGQKHRAEGQERVHWHEIKSAILYRLKNQVQISSKRRSLLAKHVVALPAETDPVDFGQRVEHEARRMGLSRAGRVYVIMDGGIWLWSLFEDRFKLCAVGTLDFYHASQHLHALAAALFPESKPEAATWCGTILHALKHHSPKLLFKTLADLMANPPQPDEKTTTAIQDANAYFQAHRTHLDYPGAAEAGLPIGSGSMESQCSQFQNRFKRRGQFWTKDGFGAFIEVAARHQNGELRSLWAA